MKTTLVQQARIKYSKSQSKLQNVLNLSDFQLKELQFKLGCSFAESIYLTVGEDDDLFRVLLNQIIERKSYWQWWNLEFNNYVAWLVENKSFNLDDLMNVTEQPRILTSYEKNYLNLIKK